MNYNVYIFKRHIYIYMWYTIYIYVIHHVISYIILYDIIYISHIVQYMYIYIYIYIMLHICYIVYSYRVCILYIVANPRSPIPNPQTPNNEEGNSCYAALGIGDLYEILYSRIQYSVYYINIHYTTYTI